jgi:hypothetical protein
MNEITERDAMTVLRQVRFALGRNYKSKIRDAWMDGNYNRDGLGQWDSQLQRIRNGFGPSWLVKANPKFTL